jgi:hypothetical protein
MAGWGWSVGSAGDIGEWNALCAVQDFAKLGAHRGACCVCRSPNTLRRRDCQEPCVRDHNRSAGGQFGYQEGYAGSASGGREAQDVFSKDGLFDELKQALAERILNAEPDDHPEAEAAGGRIAQGAAIPRRLAERDYWALPMVTQLAG